MKMKNAKKKKTHAKKRSSRRSAARKSSTPAARPIGWPESSLNPSLRLAFSSTHEEEVANDAGQSGDTTLISDIATADSESVRELVDEGQDFEAEIITGVERAADHSESVMKPRERREESER